MWSFKKLSSIFVLGAALLSPSLAMSGAGHDHGSGIYVPPTNAEVVGKASYELAIVIDKGMQVAGEQLDASWKSVSQKEVTKKNPSYYVISFTHPEEKRTLYVLLDVRGVYSGANFDGAFEGIK